jgi:RHS repeat-associated protein
VPSREWPLYTTQYLFDSMGRMRQLTYPDGEQLSYTYDQGGLLEGAAGVKQGKEYIYLLDLAYDEFGQRVKMELGNNVVSRYGYDPLNRRLKSLVTLGSEGQVLQNLSYAYDPVGNITQTVNRDFVTRDATQRTVTQSYDYDDLHRLTAANGGYAIGGDHLDKYTNNFIYDTIGNFQTKDQRHWYEDPLGGSQSERPHSSYNFAYDYKGPQPHAPTHVGGMSYKYDANGNLIQRTEDQNGKQRNIHWTEENRIARILDQGKETIFRYDDAGTRIVKRGKYGETVYVDPNFSIRNGEVASKHVFAGSTRIATKMVMQENRTGASKKTYVRPPGSTGHSGRVPEKSRGNHEGLDKQDASQPEKTNNGKAQEKQAEQGNNGKGQDKSEKTNNGKAKGQNKNDDDDADPQTLADLPGNSEQGLANALSHGQGHKYGIYKKLERGGYTVDDDGDIVVGDGGSPAPAPILNGNNSRPEEHQIYYYHGDHLGSSNVLTDRFGRNYEHLEYFPYGETWVEESRNQTNLPYKFTGKELDPETGLYYFGARYYDPRVSIWVSVDNNVTNILINNKRLKEASRKLSAYSYVLNNPIIYVDPDGLDDQFGAFTTKKFGDKYSESLDKFQKKHPETTETINKWTLNGTKWSKSLVDIAQDYSQFTIPDSDIDSKTSISPIVNIEGMDIDTVEISGFKIDSEIESGGKNLQLNLRLENGNLSGDLKATAPFIEGAATLTAGLSEDSSRIGVGYSKGIGGGVLSVSGSVTNPGDYSIMLRFSGGADSDRAIKVPFLGKMTPEEMGKKIKDILD